MEILDIVLYSLIGAVLILLALCLAIANYAGENMVNVYKHYERFMAGPDNTLMFANKVSLFEFGGRIKSEVIEGFLSDYYYKDTISLSKGVAYKSNISAYAVCAHELGHAIQRRDNQKKMHNFDVKIILSRVLSKFILPNFIVAIVFAFINLYVAIGFLGVSVLMFLAGLFSKLSTIKIEQEASENALVLLKKYADFDEEMLKSAQKVLKSAKLTYVASFLKSVLGWTMLVRKYDYFY